VRHVKAEAARSGPSLRAARAEVTRRRIAEAARRLFAARGYGATTLAAIAGEAEVAVQTVYAVYGSKAGILRALRESVLHQPDAGKAYEQALRERNLDRKLRLFAHSIRRRWEEGHDVVAINEEAGRTEPQVRQEVERVLSTRRSGLARFARSLPLRGAAIQDPAQATAVLDALTLPQVYQELVVVHGWSPDDFEAWLARVLSDQFA
jgi:TetR/AcrR family transcriptional regulator, regulator of autoinduction and epiphytic fitness